MKGFDRPLKPSWIYNFIRYLNVGDKFSEHKTKLNSFLTELHGEEGKRKVRTVLTRYYLKSESNPNSKFVEYTSIMDVCKKYPLEEVKPLLLYYLLTRSNLIRVLTQTIDEIYGNNKSINYSFLRKKVIEKFGERDITSRSLSNFLNTLVNFDVLEKKNKNEFIWKKKFQINDLNTAFMLKFYSEEFKKSPKINLDDLESYLFIYFDMPDIIEITRKFNSILWEYSSRLGQKHILFNKNFQWNQETLKKAFNEVLKK